jgi:uncharacterized protein YcfJ
MLSHAVFADASNSVNYEYGTVLNSDPVFRTVRVSVPREECWESQRPASYDGAGSYSDHRGVGTTPAIVGGVVGGAIGNAVGHSKKNKQVGALVGAVLGATLGHTIAENNRRRDEPATSGYSTREHCEIVRESHEEERVVGYRVRYEYNNRTYETRTETEPGDTIRLRVSVSPVI